MPRVPARLIPVKGIANTREAEERATSAMLAVMSVVRDLSAELFSPLGASKAQRATVEAFTEVQFKADGRTVRPDGLLRISYGGKTWAALVEVKTGDSCLELEQIKDYLRVAREHELDHVVTISNEIAPAPGVHPTPGAKVRSNSRVQLAHISWPQLVAAAVTLKQHIGVDDPEQAWLLAELIRYLEHPASGALAFTDMGAYWVQVRKGARDATLSRSDAGTVEVCQRWDQLIRYVALMMGAQTGQNIQPYVSRRYRTDPAARTVDLAASLAETGRVQASLNIPHATGPLLVIADLKARRIITSTTIDAPDDRGAKARITWLTRQLSNAPAGTMLEARIRHARNPVVAALERVAEDPTALLDPDRKEPASFTVLVRTEMGSGRKAGTKTPGFIDTVEAAITGFYDRVLTGLHAWQPKPAPRTALSEPAENETPPPHDPE